jgi:hypothetical protein
MDLSGNAWELRYLNNDIGWDLGAVSTPLKGINPIACLFLKSIRRAYCLCR